MERSLTRARLLGGEVEVAAVGGGAQAVVFAFLVLLTLVILALLFYGSVIATFGTASKQSAGLLVGNSIITIGLVLMINGQRTVYDKGGHLLINSVLHQQLGLSALCIGMLVFAVSFVLYVKKQNK